MIDTQSADFLKSEGYLVSSCPALDEQELLQCFRAFLQKERSYRHGFLQKQYGYAFDGYSYSGQPDSSHQAEDDLVSTFVLSEFYPVERYPVEFHPFLNGRWKEVLQTVRSLETELLAHLDIPGLLDFYLENAGHMASNNYYAPVSASVRPAEGNTRLSAHPDASLFTVFPFGIDEELELELKDENGLSVWQSLNASNSILLYPGYLMQMWTHGAIEAKNHRVRLGRNISAERFSFSFFSLPFPLRAFEMPGRGRMTGETYFEAYDALF